MLQIIECLSPLRLFSHMDKVVVLDDATIWQFVVPKEHDANKKSLGNAKETVEYSEREKKALTVFGSRRDTKQRTEVGIIREDESTE